MASSLVVKYTKSRCSVSIESAIETSIEKIEGEAECATDMLCELRHIA